MMNSSATSLLKKAPVTIRCTNTAILCRRPQRNKSEACDYQGARFYVHQAAQRPTSAPVKAPASKHLPSAKRVRKTIYLVEMDNR